MTIEPKTQHDLEMEYQASKLQEGLADLARKLGLRVRVSYNGSSIGGFCIDTSCIPASRYTHTIAEEILYTVAPDHRVELLIDIMEDLQRRNFEATRKHLNGCDVRGAVAVLSRADKDALHELLYLAQKGVSFPYGHDAERDRKALEAGEKVLEKLFR